MAVLSVALTAAAQSPTGISYQVVVRDTDNALVKNGPVGVSLSILQGSATGQAVYVETHQDSTNINGLVSLVLGRGSVSSGSFDSIGWASHAFYLKTEIDPTGGSSYGPPIVTQLITSPTAYYANTADTAVVGRHADTIAVEVSDEGDTLFLGTEGTFVVIPGLSEANSSLGCQAATADTTVVMTVTSPATSKIWMDRNLGAWQVATASDDALSYGDLYQWGRSADGHQCRDSDTIKQQATYAHVNVGDSWYGKFITRLNANWLQDGDNYTLWNGITGTNNPCPSGFRVPTEADWQAEVDDWDNIYTADAYNSFLKLPAPHNRPWYGEIDENFVGTYAVYWSSTTDGSKSKALSFSPTYGNLGGSYVRAVGAAVRCVKDE